MSKIEEMAKDWLVGRFFSGSEGSLKVKEFRELGIDAYISGANAVLEEIETRIAMSKHASMQTAEIILDSVEMTIKELKGL